MSEVIQLPKIMFITASVNRGGASRVISILANHYAAINWKVDFVVKETIIKGYQLHRNVKVIECGKEGKEHGYAFYRRLREIVKEENPDVVVSFLTIVNFYAIAACLGKRRLIISERNDPKLSASRWHFLLSKILYPFADGIVFQSHKVMDYYNGIVRRKGTVILNPIEVSCIKDDKAEEKKIVTAGRFVGQKNHALLIDSFAEIKKCHSAYQLYIYGDGDLRSEYEAQLSKLEIKDAVHLPGNVSNIHEKMKDAQIFVISSDYEVLSNSLLEAMAMGLACVSTRSGGAEEIISDYQNGLLVDVGNKDELVKAIEKLICDEDLRKRIQEEAIQTSQRFLKENIIHEWETMIDKVIGISNKKDKV